MANDLFSLTGKVAVVTGGAQGIGLVISRGLVDAGAKVTQGLLGALRSSSTRIRPGTRSSA